MASKDSDFKKLEDAVEVLHRLSSSTEKIDADLWRAASDFAMAISPTANIGDPNKLFKSIEAKTDTLITFGRLQSRLKKANKIANEIAPKPPPATTKGKGGLSDDQVWEKLGWKDIGGGRSMWTRPTNAEGVTEHFPPQVSRFIAQYAENEEAMAKATAIDPDSPMLPVTMEQAKEMRRVDAVRDKEKEQRENVRVAMMDDYSRFVHENTDRYGKTGAEMVFRQKLLKELPPFLKNTNLSTKTLISIDKAIKSAKGVPLVGKLMHPTALAFAALGIADSVLSSSNAANKAVTGWSASRELTGSPSRRFNEAARLAGAKDEQEVLKMYGSLLEKFGTEDAFEMMGHALRYAPPGIQRLSVARDRGLDDKQANALMYLAGEAPLESTSEAQSTAAKYSRLEDIERWGFRSGSSFTEKMRSASLWLWREKDLEARGTSWLDILEMGNPAMWGDLIMRKVLGSPTDDIDEAVKRNIESMNAAESLDEAERQGDTMMNSNVRNSAIYITNMNVQTNDPKTFSEALDGMANGDNRGLLATSGNYVLA